MLASVGRVNNLPPNGTTLTLGCGCKIVPGSSALGTFATRLWNASRANRSLACVGLDPDPGLMAVPDVLEFNRAIIDATKDLVCAFKPNMAFFEAQGVVGLQALEQALEFTVAVARAIDSDLSEAAEAEGG